MLVREASRADVADVVRLAGLLWPDEPATEHRAHMEAIVAGRPPSTLPLIVFVAEDAGRVIGFLEVGLRSHADGCDGAHPCGFLEGWYVEVPFRRRGVGRALVERAEVWCREQGCTEIASDTWSDSVGSERAHVGLGFEIVDRCTHFRKSLRS